MPHITEYEVEARFIDRLESLGYTFAPLNNYDDVLANFRLELAKFNAKKLIAVKGEASFSDAEFKRVLIHVENKSVYESARILRDQYVLTLDSGKTVYLDFFSSDLDRNIYQVSHQITMDKDHKDDVSYKNRYDVTVLINGLPLVQIELKRPGVEINEAINQINRYRSFSFRGLFRYLQIFVVSNSVQTKYFCNENETMNGTYNPILKSLVFFWTDANNKRINTLDDFTAEFFQRGSLTEMLDKYMVIKTSEPILMVMRPYQIYAVKAARRRVLEANQNGYVFACTGSGKTLTSFKLAQLLRDEPRIDKVIFLIDRKDLDDQTVDEYNSFEKDCVDQSDSTYVLIQHMKDPHRKLIVTTIQKMANAVNSKRYEAVMDAYRDKKVAFIIDECHRSQFGKMHGDIDRHFTKANYIGFTGTPIFAANAGAGGRTTADLFPAGLLPDGTKRDSCLHRYMIKDAIADGNVLRFSVEYQRTIFAHNLATKGIDPEQLDDPDYCRRHNIDIDNLYHDDERIQKIAAHIFDHHEQHIHPQGRDVYTSIFAVDYVKTLAKYYDEFKKLNDARPEDKRYRVAAIFTYGANEDMDDPQDEHSAEIMSRCMEDYNQMFGTSFGIDTFDAYRKDISKRLKQQDLPQIDILLVVNMMLTGFDAKPLNTLYLDKNLIWHSLVQAYSRTNRVYKQTKQFGQIVTFRNIKKWQDDVSPDENGRFVIPGQYFTKPGLYDVGFEYFYGSKFSRAFVTVEENETRPDAPVITQLTAHPIAFDDVEFQIDAPGASKACIMINDAYYPEFVAINPFVIDLSASGQTIFTFNSKNYGLWDGDSAFTISASVFRNGAWSEYSTPIIFEQEVNGQLSWNDHNAGSVTRAPQYPVAGDQVTITWPSVEGAECYGIWFFDYGMFFSEGNDPSCTIDTTGWEYGDHGYCIYAYAQGKGRTHHEGIRALPLSNPEYKPIAEVDKSEVVEGDLIHLTIQSNIASWLMIFVDNEPYAEVLSDASGRAQAVLRIGNPGIHSITVGDKYHTIPISDPINVTVAKKEIIPDLVLPADLITIETGAFINLPEVNVVYIPRSVSEIAEGAFDPGITLLMPCDSSLVDWARDHGYNVVEDDSQ